MKKLFYLSVILLLGAGACTPKETGGTATVRISTGNFEDSGSSLSYDGELSAIYRSYSETAVPTSDQEQVITLQLDRPTYYRICRNPLFLSPGDDLSIDLNQSSTATVISGTQGVEANDYLKQRYFTHGGSFLQSGDLLKNMGDKSVVEAVNEAADRRREDLKALQGVSKEFKRLEEARIKADLVNSLFSYPAYSDVATGKPMTRPEAEEFYRSIGEVTLPLVQELASDDRYLDIEVVRNVLFTARSMDMYKDVQFSDRFLKLVEVSQMADRIGGDITRARYDEFKAFADAIPYEGMKKTFEQKLAVNSKLMEGMPAIDVALNDMDGNALKLSALTDKPTYVDIWATWCGPCVAESPHFTALSKQYPEINFVAVSVDSNTEGWKSFLGSKEHGSVTEVIATDDMRKNWDIGGIPRFLLINKDFTIISADAPRPSQTEEITAILNRLSGK